MSLWDSSALRVSPAVTRLTVYRRLQVVKSIALYSLPKVMTGGQYGLRMFHTLPGSNTKHSCLETPGRSDLFMIFGRFFEKSWKFHAGATILEILYVSNMFLLRRMQEGSLPCRLLGRVQHENSLTSQGQKMIKI